MKRAFGCAAGVSTSGFHGIALPVGGPGRRLVGHALPPHVALVGERGVGEDAVAPHRVHGVGVGLVARAGSDAEEAGLGVDRVEPAVVAELHPADVVADGLGGPAGDRRHEHRQVRLAARRREGGGDVLRLLLRVGQLEDEHVLGQPAVVAGHHRGDAQGEALLAEQGVAAVAGPVRPDLAGLGEVDDVLVVRVARPRHVGLAGLERGADGVQAGDELAVVAEHVERLLAHAGHDPHAHGDVGGVGELHADVGDRRAERAHREGHDVHRAAAHRPGVEVGHLGAHLVGLAPVVVRPGGVLVGGADERAVLDAGDVAGVGVRPVAVRPLGLVERRERAAGHEVGAQPVVLLCGAVAPVHVVGLEDALPVVDPLPAVARCRSDRSSCAHLRGWIPINGVPACRREPNGQRSLRSGQGSTCRLPSRVAGASPGRQHRGRRSPAGPGGPCAGSIRRGRRRPRS